ncbi:MAG: hypothetical protein ACYSUV_16705 [Planctomycetota bacterium]
MSMEQDIKILRAQAKNQRWNSKNNIQLNAADKKKAAAAAKQRDAEADALQAKLDSQSTDSNNK